MNRLLKRLLPVVSVIVLGCSAVKQGWLRPEVEGRALGTDTLLGREWYETELEADPYGFGEYVDRRGKPEYVFVHGQFRVDLFYLGEDQSVQCERTWTNIVAACRVAGRIPAEIRREFSPEHQSTHTPTPIATSTLTPTMLPTAPTPTAGRRDPRLLYFRGVPIGGEVSSLPDCSDDHHPCRDTGSDEIYFQDSLNDLFEWMRFTEKDGRIVCIKGFPARARADTVIRLLSGKYGAPTTRHEGVVTNAFGAIFPSMSLRWDPKNARIFFDAPHPTNPNAASLSICDRSYLENEARKEKAREAEQLMDF